VIVGGSFTGAELAGEFHEFMRRVVRRYPNLEADDCNITLIERDDRILRALHPDLSRYAAERMRRRGITVLLGETVRSVSADHVILGSGGRIEAATTVWCAGIAPPPLVEKLDLPRDERGYILCERDCRVRGMNNVWAVGDSAVNIDAEGKPYPATAQHAVREGAHVADNLVRLLEGMVSMPFNYRTQGSLAALGCRTGVAEVFGLRLSGFPAWWLWRTLYLLKMPGLARKVRIAIDWTLDLFFRKDDVQLGVHESRR
jgi:NADH dehydrogenase